MAKIKRRPLNALDDLGAENLRRARDLFPAIERAQELMRLHQLDSLAPVVKAMQEQQELFRRASEQLQISAPAVDAMKVLAAGGEAAAAMKDAFGANSAAMEIARAMTMPTETAAAMKAALQLDTAAFEQAAKHLTTANETAAAMKDAVGAQTSALDLAKTLAPHLEAAASIRSSLAGSGVLDQIREMADLTASWRNALGDLDRITTILPPDAFATIGNVAESLRAAIPTLPVIDPALFGGAWNDTLAEAVARMRARAEQVVNDPDATAHDVEALVTEVGAMADSAPAESQAVIREYAARILLWLVREVRNDLAKVPIYRTAIALYILLTMVACPPPAPPLPPPPAALVAPVPLPDAGSALVAPGYLTDGLPAIIQRAGPEAEACTLEFFASVRSRNTRDAYVQAIVNFTNWCEGRSLELVDIDAFTVTAYIREIERDYKAATVRQHLAAIRLLFDRLVAGGVVPVNPASGVRGPKGAVNKRRTAALRPQDVRRLIDSIDASELSGLRDRALIAVMVYGFARVSPLIAMDVKDYRAQDGGRWLRLYEKHGTPHEVPTHRKAQEYLDAYVAAAGIAAALDSALWRTMAKDRSMSGRRMSRMDVYRAVRRRADDANLGAAATCQNLRAAGLSAYLANGGSVKRAQAIAAHASPRTTKLYEVTDGDELTAADIEKTGI
jgi:site-specific recombinase XerD